MVGILRVSLRSREVKLLGRRVSSANEALRRQLQLWDVEKAVHVGFEILAPMLLTLLEQQGFSFQFPGHETLMALNQLKLSHLKLADLYSPVKSTAPHSFEAFAGTLDYDKVRHHKTFGAYMASPSSTAAGLMYPSSWDDESEEYLKWTLTAGAGQGSGGVPSAFPSIYFEVTWVRSLCDILDGDLITPSPPVLTTLLEGGFTVDDIGDARAGRLAAFLRKSLDTQNGRMGFGKSTPGR